MTDMADMADTLIEEVRARALGRDPVQPDTVQPDTVVVCERHGGTEVAR